VACVHVDASPNEVPNNLQNNAPHRGIPARPVLAARTLVFYRLTPRLDGTLVPALPDRARLR